jgi:nucleoside-diphosphate-sugar epimerase
MSTSRTISIVGCGWLGLPLAKHLMERGHLVKGSKTDQAGVDSIVKSGVEGYQFSLNPAVESDNITALLDAEIIIINIPPKRRDDIEKFHWDQMRALKAAVYDSPIRKVIFVSSTSVYPNTNGEVDEQCKLPADKPSGRVLKDVENLWTKDWSLQTTVVRFGGLIGDDRLPGRFLAGKRAVKNGNAPVNLIHRDDCLGILTAIIEQNEWRKVYNASADEHPLRKDLYTKAAKNLDLEAPEFDVEAETAFKIINSELLKKELNYTFLHPDPMELV